MPNRLSRTKTPSGRNSSGLSADDAFSGRVKLIARLPSWVAQCEIVAPARLSGNQAALLDLLHQVTGTPSGRGRPCFAGSSQAKGLICTTSAGGKVRGRPGRACSSNPARRSVKRRLRQRETPSRRVSKHAAISSLDKPWAAYRIILALWT